MAGLTGRTIAILTADGVEQVEVTAPRDALRDAGATVRVLSPDGNDVRGYHYIEPGDTLPADGTIGDAGDVDALVLPGGLGGPDTLRKTGAAIDTVRSAVRAGKPVGVICHGPWLLIEADALAGRILTCVPQLSTDVTHAGATYVDEDVHVDRSGPLLISSRDHNTAKAFAQALVEQFGAAWQ
jgi:protease I